MGSPSLLFLDEPTSGLDSVSAHSLVQLLASLAHSGATVVATIHQPSAAVFFMFDRLLLLHSGQTCYFGPVSATQPLDFLSSAGFVCPAYHNPADFLMEVLSTSPDAPAKLSALVVHPPLDERADLACITLSSTTGSYAVPFGMQLRTLLQRNAVMMRREPALARARLGSGVVIGLIMGILYYDLGDGAESAQERLALLLFSMLFLTLSCVLPTIITLLPELAVLRKEYRNNWYALRAWYVAKLIADTPLLILPAALYLAVAGTMSGLYDATAWRFGVLYLGLMFLVTAMHAWGMFLSCVAPTLPVAIFLAPMSILPYILFSGFFKNVEDITWVFRWVSYISPMRYGWESLVVGTFLDLNISPMSGNQFLSARLNLDNAGMGLFWTNVGILAGFTILYRGLAFAALHRRVTKK